MEDFSRQKDSYVGGNQVGQSVLRSPAPSMDPGDHKSQARRDKKHDRRTQGPRKVMEHGGRVARPEEIE